MKASLTTAVAALALALALPAQALEARVSGTITRTLADSTSAGDGVRFGGCAIYTTADFMEAGLNCTNGQPVAFSCDGRVTSKADAMRMLDSALLAFATGRSVTIWVDDDATKRANTNNLCVVTRIDVHAP